MVTTAPCSSTSDTPGSATPSPAPSPAAPRRPPQPDRPEPAALPAPRLLPPPQASRRTCPTPSRRPTFPCPRPTATSAPPATLSAVAQPSLAAPLQPCRDPSRMEFVRIRPNFRHVFRQIPAFVAQGIEHRSPKAGVAGSNPAGGTRSERLRPRSRSKFPVLGLRCVRSGYTLGPPRHTLTTRGDLPDSS